MGCAELQYDIEYDLPVGPQNRKLETGRLGSLIPLLALRMDLATDLTALSCPLIRLPMSSSKFLNLAFSPPSNRPIGIPDISDTT